MRTELDLKYSPVRMEDLKCMSNDGQDKHTSSSNMISQLPHELLMSLKYDTQLCLALQLFLVLSPHFSKRFQIYFRSALVRIGR